MVNFAELRATAEETVRKTRNNFDKHPHVWAAYGISLGMAAWFADGADGQQGSWVRPRL